MRLLRPKEYRERQEKLDHLHHEALDRFGVWEDMIQLVKMVITINSESEEEAIKKAIWK